jgi:hypothetical protein
MTSKVEAKSSESRFGAKPHQSEQLGIQPDIHIILTRFLEEIHSPILSAANATPMF